MFRKLVVPLDTSPLSEHAAAKAAAIAHATRATLHLIHVFEPRLPAFDGGAVIDESLIEMERRQLERHLRLVAAALSSRFGCNCELAMLSGAPAAAIAKYVRQEGADLLVMSTHGRTGASRAWFGSVADTLAREATVPLLMVRPDDGTPPVQQRESAAAFERVAVALDGSRDADAILASVRAMKLPEGAEFLLLDIVSPVPLPAIDYPDAGMVMTLTPDLEATDRAAARAQRHLAALARRMEREGAAHVETKVIVSSSIAPAIVEQVKLFCADLVALTSHGRGASRLLVGSVADKILRGTHCSILLRRIRAGIAAAPRRPLHKQRALTAKRGA